MKVKANTVESVTNRFVELTTKINNTKKNRKFLNDVIELRDDIERVKSIIEKASFFEIDLSKENDVLFKMLWQLDDVYYDIR